MPASIARVTYSVLRRLLPAMTTTSPARSAANRSRKSAPAWTTVRHAVGFSRPRVVAVDLLQVIGEVGTVFGIDVHRGVDVRDTSSSAAAPRGNGRDRGRRVSSWISPFVRRSREGTRASCETASSGSRSSPAASARRNTSGEVQHAARALLPADHREVRLMAVEPREEHDARLVEARRRGEDVTRQRHRGRENGVEPRAVAGRERGQRGRCRGRDRHRRCRAARRSGPVASPPISAAKLKSSPVYMRTPRGSARAARSPWPHRAATP